MLVDRSNYSIIAGYGRHLQNGTRGGQRPFQICCLTNSSTADHIICDVVQAIDTHLRVVHFMSGQLATPLDLRLVLFKPSLTRIDTSEPPIPLV